MVLKEFTIDDYKVLNIKKIKSLDYVDHANNNVWIYVFDIITPDKQYLTRSLNVADKNHLETRLKYIIKKDLL